MEPFSPNHNAIVGRNGFVLNDAYNKLSVEERGELLHEGTGPAADSAFVEIILDNVDKRFPTGNESVVLRRTISAKKDEYALDKRAVTKSDVMNLLQAAGFSRANPYYIVPQGRITTLTNARDDQRLELLEEVAGTKVYEEHKQESLRIIAETEMKRQKIEEFLGFIDERMSELCEERDEWERYTNLEQERKCVEYAIYQRELAEIHSSLEDAESEFGKQIAQTGSAADQARILAEHLEKASSQLRMHKQELSLLADEHLQMEAERATEIRDKASLELSVSEMRSSEDRLSKERKAVEKELAKIESSISKKEQELDVARRDVADKESSKKSLQVSMKDAESTRDALHAKKNRASEFKSVAERDKWIKKEVNELASICARHTVASENIAEEIADATMHCNRLERAIQAMSSDLSAKRAEIQEIEQHIHSAKTRRNEIADRKKDRAREQNRLESLIRTLRDEKASIEKTLLSTTDRNTALGLESLPSLVQLHKIDGVYGPVYELFEIDEIYNAAVDAIGGSRLFHVVVRDDQVASKLLALMVEEKAGRLTLMPLNRLKSQEISYPMDERAVPLIDALKFDPHLEKAFQHIFGKALLCPDLSVGSEFARAYGLASVTIDGDRLDKCGALTGGFNEHNRSRIELAKKVQKLSHEISEKKESLVGIREEITKIDAEITASLSELQVLEKQRGSLASDDTLRERKRELAHWNDVKRGKERALQEIRDRLQGNLQKKGVLEAELGSPLNRKFSPQDESLLVAANETISQLRRSISADRVALSEANIRVKTLENELSEQLYRHREELQAKAAGNGCSKRLQWGEEELRHLEQRIACKNKRAQEISLRMDELAHVIREENSAIEAIRSDQSGIQNSVDDHQMSTDKFLAKKHQLEEKQEQCHKKIRDLGILPDGYDKHREGAPSALLKMLHKLNEEFKAFGVVNRRATEQLQTFGRQKDELMQRKSELDESSRSIREFIKVLDLKKEEAIQGTFKTVAANFKDIFSALVPNGSGELEMLRDVAPKRGKKSGVSVLPYSGISIKVSFTARESGFVRMQQLSGGQKSLVSLTLIFAIQRCDPAPFYLFDEIDANLDAAHRTAVAGKDCMISSLDMIFHLSRSAQFITTTFRPELLEHADKFYGVSFSNKLSRIEEIRREDAIGFVEEESAAE